MAQTTVAFIKTQKMSSYNKVSTGANFVQSVWNDDVDDGNYSMETTVEKDVVPSLDSPNGACDAKSQVANDSDVTSLLEDYDAVVCYDSRSYSGSDGCANIAVAGSNNAVAYNTGGKLLAGHELGHVYGGKHADTKEEANNGNSHFENAIWDYSLLGDPDHYSCNANKEDLYRDGRFSGCAKTKFQSYIDSNL